MKLLFVFLFSFAVFASQVTDNTFKVVKPTLDNVLKLNNSYSAILKEARQGKKLDDKLSIKILEQIKNEKVSLNRSTRQIDLVESALKLKEITDVDKINLNKMKEALANSKDYTETKISTLRAIILTSKNFSTNKV